MTWALHKAGVPIGFVPRARVLLEPVTSWDALYGQRVRWARGQLEVSALNRDALRGGRGAAVSHGGRGKHDHAVRGGGQTMPNLLLFDHTLAFPRLVWVPLILFFPLLGYSPKLIAVAIVAMYVLYLIIEAVSALAAFNIAEEDTRTRVEHCGLALLGLPFYRFVVFHFRFSGFLMTLTEDQQWTVPGGFDRTLERLDIARLRTVQMAGSAAPRRDAPGQPGADGGRAPRRADAARPRAGREPGGRGDPAEELVTDVSRIRLHRAAVVLVALAAVALVAYKLVAQFAVGPAWDSFSYLANAAAFAGKGFGYTEPARPPLISLIAALPLAFGVLDARVIQAVDALLALVSLAGFFLLLRRRFERPTAAVATLALLASPVVWQWVGVGYTDFAAMGLCAWALYFCVRAAEDDPRFYLLALPTLVAASLMRFTSLLFVMPFAIYVAFRARPFRDAKWLAGGAVLGVLGYAPFAAYYARTVSDALYPFMASLQIQDAGSSVQAAHELASYIGSLPWLAAPRPLAAITLVVVALGVLGLVASAWRYLRSHEVGPGRILGAAAVVLAVTWVARNAGFAATQVCISAGVALTWHLLASQAETSRLGTRRTVAAQIALDAVMVAWLLAFFTFPRGLGTALHALLHHHGTERGRTSSRWVGTRYCAISRDRSRRPTPALGASN